MFHTVALSAGQAIETKKEQTYLSRVFAIKMIRNDEFMVNYQL
jgi:hypothetical protein